MSCSGGGARGGCCGDDDDNEDGVRGERRVAAVFEFPPLETNFAFDFGPSFCAADAADGDDALDDEGSLADDGRVPPPLSLSALRCSPATPGLVGDFFFLAEAGKR